MRDKLIVILGDYGDKLRSLDADLKNGYMDGIEHNPYDELNNDAITAIEGLFPKVPEITGGSITVWKDGGWKRWRKGDASYAENDPDWLCTIPAESPYTQGQVAGLLAAKDAEIAELVEAVEFSIRMSELDGNINDEAIASCSVINKELKQALKRLK